MRIEHIAIWVADLEGQRGFYERYFGGKASDKYRNPRTGFESYFLSFESGARLELMKSAETLPRATQGVTPLGFAHLAIRVGDRAAVESLTLKLASEGATVVSKPRVTGDGYYESVVLDPEGNRLEIVA